ncbi:hypothetical protein LAZ67_9001736 [Cordylochernes scorpioides]|uniref:Transposase n=1 Tax=Cordylochernes scorpioides TaxID=51811 RepID=A0ABY6KY87_9ARAC|nr:hypothetical protein LAZ67_9001736 [Cordylochernes scorpioides]
MVLKIIVNYLCGISLGKKNICCWERLDCDDVEYPSVDRSKENTRHQPARTKIKFIEWIEEASFDKLLRFLSSKRGYILLASIYLVYLIPALYGITRVDKDTNSKNFFHPESEMHRFISVSEKYFSEYQMRVQVVIPRTLDYSNPKLWRSEGRASRITLFVCPLHLRVLTAEQKQRRVDVCREMLNELENNPDFLDNVVTGDESLKFQYDPETKAQSSEWHTPASPRPKKARMSKSRVKAMLIVFFDKRGGKLLMPNSTKKSFGDCTKPSNGSDRTLLNAPAHTAFLVTSYLTRIGVEVLPQPPYCPEMSPPDFFLFPKVKRCLMGHRFDDIPNIQRAVTKALTGITPTDYSGAYEAWKTRWQRCVTPKASSLKNINVLNKSDE